LSEEFLRGCGLSEWEILSAKLYDPHLESGEIAELQQKIFDELLNGEIFDMLLKAKILIERWRREYNQVRPHSALGYTPPAPEVCIPGTLKTGENQTEKPVLALT